MVIPAKEPCPDSGQSPEDYALTAASQKCREVFDLYPNSLVIGADTVVVLDERIMGKPETPQEAVEMLQMLSGREHRVITGVCVAYPGGEEDFFQESFVRFGVLTEEEIERYVSTGEPMDKAGAYGIQGHGACLVEEVRGSYTNVVGLPVRRLYLLLKEVLSSWRSDTLSR